MANYTTTITNEGAALLASVIANQGTLTFNEFRFSENDYTGQESTLTEGTFLGVFITASAAASVIDSTTIKASAQFNNSTITGNHDLYSIGIIGTDGNTTALIAVCTTTDPDVIREPLTGTSTYAFNVNLTVSDTSQINVYGTTAAVVYDTDSINILSDVDAPTPSDNDLLIYKGSTSKWIATQNPFSNENHVDNPFFTVNQRGVTSGGFDVSYKMDRWQTSYTANTSGTWLLNSSGLSVDTTNVSSGNNYFAQTFSASLDTSKLYTASVMLSDGTFLSYVITSFPASLTTPFGSLYISATDFTIAIGAGKTVTFRAVKLELGSVSTLANDVEPDYAFELAKCRASTADPSDTYANKGNLVNYADLTTIHAIGSTNTTGATITNGTFFYLNGSYCRAIADIANGATFTLNTNFKVANVSDEISEKTLTVTAGTGVTINNATFKQVGHLIAFSLEFTTSSALNQYAVIATIDGTLTSIIVNYYNVISSTGAKTNYMLYTDAFGRIGVGADGLPVGSYSIYGFAFVQ